MGEEAVDVGEEAVDVGEEAVEVGEEAVGSEDELDPPPQAARPNDNVAMIAKIIGIRSVFIIPSRSRNSPVCLTVSQYGQVRKSKTLIKCHVAA